MLLRLYSVSPSPNSDVSTQSQLVSVCTHSLFWCERKLACAISFDACDLKWCFANTRAMSLPEGREMECNNVVFLYFQTSHLCFINTRFLVISKLLPSGCTLLMLPSWSLTARKPHSSSPMTVTWGPVSLSSRTLAPLW